MMCIESIPAEAGSYAWRGLLSDDTAPTCLRCVPALRGCLAQDHALPWYKDPMTHLLMFIAFFFQVDADAVERLVAFAPQYLDQGHAREHLAAARVAAKYHRIDAAILLAIAFNESRYDPLVDDAKVSGSRACGLMSATQDRCDPAKLTVTDGYLAGAAILRGWIDEAERPRHPNTVECRKRSSPWQCAMTGYAGGWNALNVCNTRRHANCGYPDVVLRRAARIRGRDAAPY